MKLNGYNYYSFASIEYLDMNLSFNEEMALFGDLYNERCDNIFASEGFRRACEKGLVPFEICTNTHNTSDEYEYHHIAVLENEEDSPTVYSVLFK